MYKNQNQFLQLNNYSRNRFVETEWGDRLHDLRVGLVDTWPTTDRTSVIAMNAICAILDGPQPDRRVVIQCEENARGRYLVIQIDDDSSYLTLCEVEVFTAKRK